MKTLLVCCLCLLSNGAWAREEEKGLAEENPREHRAPALWIQPLPLTLLPLAFLPIGFTSVTDGFLDQPFSRLVFIQVPLGLTVPVSAQQDLVFEFTPFYQQRIWDTSLFTQAVYASMGSAWRLSPDRHGQGWFIQPKLLGVVAQTRLEFVHQAQPLEQQSTQLSLGLDVGYRLGSDRIFLELVAGLSVGYGWRVPDSKRSVIAFATDGVSYQGGALHFEDKVVWDYNLNLLRFGFQF